MQLWLTVSLLTASLLIKVCHTEPRLQPIKWRIFIYTTAQPFWFAAQDAYFDARVFHPNVPSNSSRTIKAAYKKHEDENKRAYGQRVRDNEQGVFTPLVFSTTGGLGQEATTFYKRLACRHARLEIRKNYSCSIKVISWLRCKLCFAAVRSSIMCIRGTRSSNHGPLTIQEGSNLINCHYKLHAFNKPLCTRIHAFIITITIIILLQLFYTLISV